MEREFVLFSRKGFTAPFDANEPEKGRMDLVARCVSAAFFISYAIRKDVIFHVFLNCPPDPPRQLTLTGRNLTGIKPNEQTILQKINQVLEKRKKLKVWPRG